MNAHIRVPGSRPCRRAARMVRAAVAMVLVAACSSSATKSPAKTETLRLGVIEVSDNLPSFVMSELGLAAREGLRLVESVEIGGAAAIRSMEADKIDVTTGVGIPPMYEAAVNGTVPATVVGVASGLFADPEHLYAAVVVPNDVESWQDLAGRPVAVNAPVSLGGGAVPICWRSEGLPTPDLVELPFRNMGLALRTGDVGAAAMFEPFVTQSVLRGDGRILGWILGGEPMVRVQATMAVMRTALLRERPAAVRAFLRAYVRALQWINTHGQEARELLARRLNLSPEVATAMHMQRWAPDGKHAPEQVVPIIEMLAESQGTPRIDPGVLYDDRPLESALAER